jgi:predicted transposase YdaD
METDIPLKALTAACAPDLLPLLGSPDATVLGVETLELPAMATRLDNVLRLRSPGGADYLHLVEWQGYRDPRFLARALYYRAWLGLDRQLPIMVTLIYLQPTDDTGDTLRHTVDGRDVFMVPFHCVRLWEQDAATALASGRPGLAALTPFMRGADHAVVEQAAALILHATSDAVRQADLLAILGVFAEAWITPAQLEVLLGRERLMSSDLLTYLMREKTAELERQRAEERAELERQSTETARLRQTLEQAVEDAMIVRFPTAPFALVDALRAIRDPEHLLRLHRAILEAPDQLSAERAIREAGNPSR